MNEQENILPSFFLCSLWKKLLILMIVTTRHKSNHSCKEKTTHLSRKKIGYTENHFALIIGWCIVQNLWNNNEPKKNESISHQIVKFKPKRILTLMKWSIKLNSSRIANVKIWNMSQHRCQNVPRFLSSNHTITQYCSRCSWFFVSFFSSSS